jgi:hypothetical protein
MKTKPEHRRDLLKRRPVAESTVGGFAPPIWIYLGRGRRGSLAENRPQQGWYRSNDFVPFRSLGGQPVT